MEDLYIYTWERFSLWELRSDQLQFFFFFFRSRISMWIVFREREGNVPRSRFLERANIREITFDFFFEEGKKRAKIEIRWTESVFYLAKAKRDRMKKGKRERKERWIERVRPPSPMIEFASSSRWGRDNLLLIPKKIAWKIGETLAPCFLYQRPPAWPVVGHGFNRITRYLGPRTNPWCSVYRAKIETVVNFERY